MPDEQVVTQQSSVQVLVVEDDPDMNRMMIELLEGAGLQTMTAEKATEALDHIERWRVDLMILDIHMPGASGVDLLKVLRRRRLNIPTIIVSGFIHEDLARDLATLGVHKILAKPFPKERLMAEILSILTP